MKFNRSKNVGISLLGGMFLVFMSSAVGNSDTLADGFHLPNFYQPTVAESWAKVKQQFQFPELPKGKTWSDGYPLGGFDKKIRSHKTVRKNTPIKMVLKSVIMKMIAVYKYSDPYNFAYDSPPWMRTLAEREKSVVEAQAVLVEIGVGALPYLWEELVQNVRFENHARKKGIEVFRDAQQALSMAHADLVDAVRAKDPKLVELEDALEKGTVAFWQSSSLIGSTAGKLNAQYIKQLFNLRKLIHNHARTDPEIKKFKDAEGKAKINLRQALGKCPGDYSKYQGINRVSDDFGKRLKDTILTYGKHAREFLRRQSRHRSHAVRTEVLGLLKSLQELEAKALAKKEQVKKEQAKKEQNKKAAEKKMIEKKQGK